MQHSIAIADDSMTARRILVMGIQKTGNMAKIDEYSSGYDMLNGEKETKHDIIFLDIDMPDIHGDRIISMLKTMNPSVKIIMCTSNGRKDCVLSCIRRGATDFIVKPIEMRTVITLLTKYLNQ